MAGQLGWTSVPPEISAARQQAVSPAGSLSVLPSSFSSLPPGPVGVTSSAFKTLLGQLTQAAAACGGRCRGFGGFGVGPSRCRDRRDLWQLGGRRLLARAVAHPLPCSR